jgi:superfamily II DNA or RNA helicase
MKRKPRPYQLDAKAAIRDGFRRQLKGVGIELFTGAGKGFIIADIAKDVKEKGGRVLVLVNRDNLCDQLAASLVEQGMYPMIERGMDKASPLSDVVVGSIPTMQGERLKKWNPEHFKMVITDEAHFAAAKTFKNTLDYFKSSYHLFLTATMERHDKAGLWGGCEELVYSMPLQEGINQGWLVPFDFEELPVPIEISDKDATKKMWTEKDESEVFSAGAYLPRLFAESASKCHDKKSLFFWPNCDSSKEAEKHFQDNGIESRHVDGYMTKQEIAEILEWFKSPGFKALHNADLLSYGYDNPTIDCIGIMRLSRSIPMLKQRLGRGTRPICNVDQFDDAELRKMAIAQSEKPTCKVLDLMIQLGAVKNKFAEPTCLITDNEEEKEYIREEMRKSGRAMSMQELEGKLKVHRATNKEKMLAKLAEDAANAALKRPNMKKEPWYGDILKSHITGIPITPKQLGFLKSLGYTGPEKVTKYQASRLIGRFMSHKEKQNA